MLAPKQAFVRQMLAEGRTIAETAAAARLSFAQVAAIDGQWSAPKGKYVANRPIDKTSCRLGHTP